MSDLGDKQSNEGGNTIYYIILILAIVIFSVGAFCAKYNDKEVSSKLASRGITVYAKVDSVYVVSSKNSVVYYALLNYVDKGHRIKLPMPMNEGQFSINDTVILRKLPDYNISAYSRIIGFRRNGSEFSLNRP